MSALALLVAFDPNAVNSIFPPCLFHTFSGLYCPGCGATRALHAILHGDLALAWTMNPLLVLALPTVLALTVQQLRPVPNTWDLAFRKIGNARFWAILVIVFSVLRNIPTAPFTWLAPG